MKILNQLMSFARLDLSPAHRPPAPARMVLATAGSIIGSLVADTLLVVIGEAVFPSTKGYVHFRFSDYTKLTVIGVVIACVAWPVVVRLSSAPRWLFSRLAILVTLFLWLPDLYLLHQGQPAEAVAVLMVMHLAIALVTYNLLVHAAAAVPKPVTIGDQVRILLHQDSAGSFEFVGRGVPDDLDAELARFHSADVVLGSGAVTGRGATDEMLVYTAAAPSPLGTEMLGRPHDLLMVFAYYVLDEAAVLEFDTRITEEYTRFFQTRDVHYAGLYHVSGLGDTLLGEIVAWDGVRSIEEAERLGNDDLPRRIVEIEDACRALQDREASRFALWLTPKARAPINPH